jgi:hypothetical protein
MGEVRQALRYIEVVCLRTAAVLTRRVQAPGHCCVQRILKIDYFALIDEQTAMRIV